MLRIAFAVALVACTHSTPGVRSGVSTDDDDPVLAGLDLGVNAAEDVSRPLVVTVWLDRPGASRDRCFTATSDIRVSVDGHPATLGFPGGIARPQRASGMEWQIENCSPAMFTWQPDPGAPRPDASQVVVERAGHHAEMTVAHLLATRTLAVRPGTTVHAGDHVTLEWNPRADEWSGYPSDPEVHLYEPSEITTHAHVVAAPPDFRFTMPAVRPGKIRLDLNHLYLEAHPKIRSCIGVAKCESQVHNGPRELELDVAP
jgi:hypothetical protein